jgi:SAM-dependent methyltransferase/uncharacterized protein YbaR (Trm112 family)
MNQAKTRNATQSIDNLRGEVEFRSKLAIQHVTGEILLPDYYEREAHDQILLERMETTRQKMIELNDRGIHFSPFLELGAERGQRSLVLANDFGAEGVAVDISFHQLRAMEHFARLFQKEKLPVRICCNANHLPFQTNSFPFIFCYQFLHHFPNLEPIFQEIHRVLADGTFYFDEEPYRRVLKLILFKQKDKQYSKKTLRKNPTWNLLESFISEPACEEVEYGILENHNIAIREWIDALARFDEQRISLSSIYNIASSLSTHLHLRNIPNVLLGGIISGMGRKTVRVDRVMPKAIFDLLGCPDCVIPLSDGSFDRPPLIRHSAEFLCQQCETRYPIRDGILVLLPKEELQQLYPNL